MSLDILQPRPSKMRTMPLKTNPKNNQKQLSNQLMRRKRNKIYLILFVNKDNMATSWSRGGFVFITADEKKRNRILLALFTNKKQDVNQILFSCLQAKIKIRWYHLGLLFIKGVLCLLQLMRERYRQTEIDRQRETERERVRRSREREERDKRERGERDREREERQRGEPERGETEREREVVEKIMHKETKRQRSFSFN
uniref:Uncharacterized protein n=1 Tax=Cacopsylla melanoneura TaxID=428564 RepID=A0A8D8X3H3_9HEMI